MTQLRSAVGDAGFVFVVGKGGTGKTTAAGALALEYADAGDAIHLISTDPAHSLGDLFEQRLTGTPSASACSARLQLEEFDAAAFADAWLTRALPAVAELIEAGTWLDAADVLSFSRLALPGVDELMAVLRLVDLQQAGGRVIVDTAPTGHTLRLIDAAAAHDGIARALRAMADKGAAVASGMTGRTVRLGGEAVIDELGRYVQAYREAVLRPAAFVIATRPGAVVRAETERLTAALGARGLRIAATVVGAYGRADGGAVALSGPALAAPLLRRASGCDALRAWRNGVRPYEAPVATGAAGTAAAPQPRTAAPPPRTAAADAGAAGLPPAIHAALATDFLLFAGKGGVGKSTCAAAAALSFAASRDVLLCSADPAGSLDDVLGGAGHRSDDAAPDPGTAGARLRVLQIDPAAELAVLRDAYETDVLGALERLGISAAATLDRRVIEALWDLAPPGIDELAALAAMLDAAEGNEMVVLDAAPTGHFLRLLEMPDVALDWTRQLMRIVVKYGLAGSGGIAQTLLRLAHQLRALQALLHDAARAAVVIVTLDQPVAAAESARLARTLGDAGFRIAAVVHNRVVDGAGPAIIDAGLRVAAPLQAAPIIGPHALREFAGAWNIVA